MWPEFKFIINMALSYGLGYLLARLSARKEIKRLHEKCEKLQEFIDKYGGDCNG
jgi:membrane protein DedA with SNARE-associated domain